MSNSPLRALSVRQPYAEQILSGHKQVEYRSRLTHFRGIVYLYACKAREPVAAFQAAGLEAEKLIFGKLIGTVEIVDCTRGKEGYEWHLQNARRFRHPQEITGMPQPSFFWPFGEATESRCERSVQE